MQIDLGKIIELANMRKERLEYLCDRLGEVDDVIEKVEFALAWAEAVAEAWHDLDTEGRNLIPDAKVKLALENIVPLRDKLKEVLFTQTSGTFPDGNMRGYGLRRLRT